MIVDDPDLPRRAIAPDKTNAPLVVDPDAVLPVAIVPQSLQPIAGWCAQILKPACRIDQQEFHSRALLDRCRQATSGMAGKDGSRAFVGEAPDHGST